MLLEFQLVWNTLGSIISALPSDVVNSVVFVFCSIGVIGILRSL